MQPSTRHPFVRRTRLIRRARLVFLWTALLSAVTLALGSVPASAANVPRPLALVQANALAGTGWIIEGSGLAAMSASNPSLTQKYFDSPDTIVLADDSSNPNQVPAGWSSIPAEHFTSVQGPCALPCYGISTDLQPLLSQNNVQIGMYDNEHWNKTPAGEQPIPCTEMPNFVSTANSMGLTSIAAPDQNLASPQVYTPGYQGGESENWQTFLRLGYAACAAASGAKYFHIMNQSYEAYWCGNPEGLCQGGEADFINYATQAALQAKAVNPNVILTDGVSTSTRYFNQAGDPDPASGIYQDASDVADIVNTVWLNVIGTTVPAALNVLSDIDNNVPVSVHKSVLFAQPGGVMGVAQPTGSSASSMDLSTTGNTSVFVSPTSIPGGTTIPAGTYEFQYWTGPGTGTATLKLNLGYCQGDTCANRVRISPPNGQHWEPVIAPGAAGAAVPDGALTTTAATTLPAGGPYHLYWSVQVLSPGQFSLNYGGGGAATNIATPILFDEVTGAVVPLAHNRNS